MVRPVLRRSFGGLVAPLELDGAVLGSAAKWNAQGNLPDDFGFSVRDDRRIGAVASAHGGSRGDRRWRGRRRRRSLERAEVRNLPDGFFARGGRHYFFLQPPPFGFDGMAAVAINALLGQLRRRHGRLFPKLLIGVQ